MDKKSYFRRLLRNCVKDLNDLKYGKKVDSLYDKTISGELALIVYIQRLADFVDCVLNEVGDPKIKREAQRFRTHIEQVRARIARKQTVKSRKAFTNRNDLSVLSSLFASRTKLLKELDRNKTAKLKICPIELENKHKAHVVLWNK